MNVQFPRCLRCLAGKNLLWEKPSTTSKVIYLTFDDGPVPEVTPQLLDFLDRQNVKATFFCVGENVQKYPAIFADIKKRSHAVGNHTFSHLRGFHTPLNTYMENVKRADTLIQSRLFRPPHGQITRQQRKALLPDFQIVMWDIITHDYNQKLSPDEVLKNVLRHSRNGSIVVFHDSLKAQANLWTVLPAAIDFWKYNGYQLKTL